jgi:hypothetical protein
MTSKTHTEFALMIDWEDGEPAEFIPAVDAHHAEQMARTIYHGRSTWTVQREVPAWCYLGSDIPAALTSRAS